MSKTRHFAPKGLWGQAVDYTRIDKEGKMWIGNGEYETQANYCPFTGEPAPKQMKSVDVESWNYDDGVENKKLVTVKEYINE